MPAATLQIFVSSADGGATTNPHLTSVGPIAPPTDRPKNNTKLGPASAEHEMEMKSELTISSDSALNHHSAKKNMAKKWP